MLENHGSPYKISKFLAQYGKCAITKVELSFNDWHCHHKKPLEHGGDDSYSNLIILHEDIHRLIHMVDINKIKPIIAKHQINKEQLQKINSLRKQADKKDITLEQLLVA